jgi:hypothetical protein
MTMLAVISPTRTCRTSLRSRVDPAREQVVVAQADQMTSRQEQRLEGAAESELCPQLVES